MFPRFSIFSRLFFGWAFVVSLASQPSANAWPWNSEPQPVLHRREPIRADAGSPLAWDQSARALWFVRSHRLNFAWWTGHTFDWQEFREVVPEPSAGLIVDSGWHFLYYTQFDKGGNDPYPNLRCLRRTGEGWWTGRSVTTRLANSSESMG
jgi:hypothetical protein